MQRAGHGYCLTNRKEIHSLEVGEKRRIWYQPDITFDKETKVSEGAFATIKVKRKNCLNTNTGYIFFIYEFSLSFCKGFIRL